MNATPKRAMGERTQTLKAVPFFTQLNDHELDVVRAVATEKSYPKNAVVLTEGEMGDSLFMIQSGKVKVFIGDEDGREIILKILGPGDFFGEMSMIDKQPRSASVTTIEPASFLVLSHAAFERCVEQAPRIANMVMRVLATRVREAGDEGGLQVRPGGVDGRGITGGAGAEDQHAGVLGGHSGK